MVQYKVFYVPLFDDGRCCDEMNAFLRSHRVLNVAKRELPDGWGFCVEWLEGTPSAATPTVPPYYREKVDYMKVLEPEAFKRFSEYRRRRKNIALTDGVKPFVVMTDAQMAELAKIESPQLADLKKIDGFGDARVEKFGERLLTELPEETQEAPQGEDS